LAPSCARAAHSDSATGAPSSEAAPSLEVAVAVTDAGIAPGASTVSGQIAKGAEKK
jgi:hypothetical protein